ncbi:MAG: DUF4173 domain-containing protein [Fimbriimonas ginsengisoli]|uniref:DUF4173 domain-containing protein n=1 Tax=Fimbriimonas ginsengisoli TaxID=1005039 RepID=A0A931LUG9_FIMGI|nr:DUF4173 domain-containing protein [Fimbriimonas ginsengisoli]
MTARTRIGAAIFLSSLGLGILGDSLFHSASYGLNLPLWTIGLFGGAIALSRWAGKPLGRAATLIATPVLLFALCFFWREAPELKIANGTAIVLLVGAALVRSPQGDFARASILDLTTKALFAWVGLARDFVDLVTKDVPWPGGEGARQRAKAVFRGLILATPLLIVFGLLFASADAVFGKDLGHYLSLEWLDMNSVWTTIFNLAIFAGLAGGLYRRMLMAEPKPDVPVAPPKIIKTIGLTEVAVTLSSLILMFGGFVAVQARAFFGDAAYVRESVGLSYAEYARAGFFELLAVAAIALGVLLGLHAVLERSARNQRVFAGLASGLVALVGVVVVSAMCRLSLYVQEYGLTELRVYSAALILWLAFVFVWLLATVLHGHRQRFAFGALAGACAAIAALNAINPDALIARVNLASAHHPDLEYLQTLSLDASAEIDRGLARLPAADANQLRSALSEKWREETTSDWRSMNVARWRYLHRGPATISRP